jgi:hypothetical protein
LIRRALPFGLALSLIGLVVYVASIVPSSTRDNDRYYLVYSSIHRAEKLAKICFLKSPDGRHPVTFSELRGMDAHELSDAWGNPFHYATVANADGELELYIRTEWIDNRGWTSLIGAKARADGTTTRFGLPPQD